MRIGFLFNHDQVHQIAHSLPMALALSRRRTGAEILVCSTNDRITREIRTLGGPAIEEDLELVELNLATRFSRVTAALAGGIIPSRKLLIYRDNLDFFRSLDVLVVPEKTSLVLKDRFHLDHLKIIHTRHGAGDRSIGFNKASARFDHILAAGPKIRDRLIRDAGVAPHKISIVGYPKFDIFPRLDSNVRLPKDRPVVLYNPHVAPHLSSWYKYGRSILQWFAKHPVYQLIFAPHIMLFERKTVVTIQPPRIARPGSVPQFALDAENIMVDTHSRALTTMEYLNRADIYLGDVSSQIYEFLVEPRPCLFFNAHSLDWAESSSFAHWHAGRVLNDVAELGEALSSASEDHRVRYRALQEEMFRATIDLRDTPSSSRAVDVILEVAGAHSRRSKARPKRSRKASEPSGIVGTLAQS